MVEHVASVARLAFSDSLVTSYLLTERGNATDIGKNAHLQLAVQP